jgi:hypothetical protein
MNIADVAEADARRIDIVLGLGQVERLPESL